MIRIKIYVDDVEGMKEAIYDIADYRKRKNLVIWEMKSYDDSPYTQDGKPDTYIVEAVLVSLGEAERLLKNEKLGDATLGHER